MSQSSGPLKPRSERPVRGLATNARSGSSPAGRLGLEESFESIQSGGTLRAIGQEGAAVIGRGTTRMTASGLGRVVQLTNLTDSTQPTATFESHVRLCSS